jgi:hypothetical protein
MVLTNAKLFSDGGSGRELIAEPVVIEVTADQYFVE